MSDVRPSWSERLAGIWGRAESTVTKIVLAAVFALGLVAQFVKPVGDALQGKVYLGGALLTAVSYVLYSEVQRLNVAHTIQQETAQAMTGAVRQLEEELQRLNAVLRPRVVLSAVQDEVRQTLEAGGTVQLAAMGFTGETFTLGVKSILQRLSRDPLRRVHLRVLVPDFTKKIEIPGQVDADGKASDAPRFREHLRRMVVEHERGLRAHIGRMAVAGQGTLTVEFRVLHMSPSRRLYFINSDVVYEGSNYKLVLRPDPEPAAAPDPPGSDTARASLLDVIGNDPLLDRWSLDGGDQARKIIADRQEFFETLWLLAREMTPATCD
ncbi:ATP/GTP-binding protein [Streptomyces sp. YS415]|uniref:ATP/GTP-binding protein n=1 Tax=Streptomyces sp. YS415 TaxID=2944806 RepID=UPI002021CBF0|nr:ATP/GTP-binding protein [Streptomyces sp. YS415]MCL7430156.1 ATP/GTP-binding protein [Streptomyces sp. YS415]